MKKNFLCLTLCATLFMYCFSAEAQQPAKIPRIGFVSGSGTPSSPAFSEKAFRQGLKELGYVEGENILIDFRYAAGVRDQIPTLVAELVQMKVDMFVTGNLTAILAAKQATKTIPIVMVTGRDPVADGLIETLAHPAGNITGLATLNRDLSGNG